MKLSKKVNELKKFVVTNEERIKVVAKGKNRKAPGTHSMQTSSGGNLSQRKELWQDHIRN